MIPDSLVLQSPFPEPGLVWRELRFERRADRVTEGDDGQGGPLRITLPADLENAVPKRRSEFLAGRLCAGLALRAMGLPPDVPRLGRAPVWPPGVVGSISHNDSRAIAAVSLHHVGLGVDVEELIPAPRAAELADRIITADEAALAAGLDAARFLTLAFSAKEAFYKAMSHRLDHIPEFLDVCITRLEPDRLSLDFAGQPFVARYLFSREDCLTMVALSA